MMGKIKIILVFLVLTIVIGIKSIYAQPAEEQLKKTRSIKTVRLIIEQSYTESGKDMFLPVSLPFKSLTERLLRYSAGLKIVKDDTKNYDATLKIQVKGEARGNAYIGRDIKNGTFRYVNAFLKGTICFKASDNIIFQKSFEGLKENIAIAANSTRFFTPAEAPFSDACWEFFVPAILEMIGDVYGPNSLILILKSKDEEFFMNDMGDYVVNVLTKIGAPALKSLTTLLIGREEYYSLNIESKAIKALTKIGTPAVKSLINVLKESHEPNINMDVASALNEITGQDFGQDATKWQEWWEKNKEKFGKDR